ERTHFSECHGSVSAYGVFHHRHGAEIEQGVGRQVTFTPHLVPLDRGILSTIYVRVAPGTTEETIADVFARAYAGATFVRLVGGELLEDPAHLAHVVTAIKTIARGAAALVIIHGGGKEIDAALHVAGIEKQQIDGLRITNDATLDIAVAVLAGSINTRLVAAL